VLQRRCAATQPAAIHRRDTRPVDSRTPVPIGNNGVVMCSATVVPLLPTAQPWVASQKEAARRGFPCGSGFCHTHPPSLVEMNAAARGGVNAAASRRSTTRHTSTAGPGLTGVLQRDDQHRRPTECGGLLCFRVDIVGSGRAEKSPPHQVKTKHGGIDRVRVLPVPSPRSHNRHHRKRRSASAPRPVGPQSPAFKSSSTQTRHRGRPDLLRLPRRTETAPIAA